MLFNDHFPCINCTSRWRIWYLAYFSLFSGGRKRQNVRWRTKRTILR